MAHLRCFPEPVPYREAVALQESLVAQRLADEIPDTFLLLQHPPVITLGRRGRREHLLVSDIQLQALGVELVHASRGGDVTYHGPGQWVLYPILKLSARESGTHGYLSELEELAIRTAQHFGVDAARKPGMAGAWCGKGKFAAIGFALKRWVTYHGMSLNVNLDLSGFNLIVGCGLVGEPVTSLQEILGPRCPDMAAVRDELLRQIPQVMGRELEAVRTQTA